MMKNKMLVPEIQSIAKDTVHIFVVSVVLAKFLWVRNQAKIVLVIIKKK